MPPKRVVVAGVGFDRVTFRGAAAVIARLLSNRKRGQLVVTPNPEMLVAAATDAVFRAILNRAAIVVADGIGVIVAAYFLSRPERTFFALLLALVKLVLRRPELFSILPERVTGTDLVPEILHIAARRGERVFLLGAGEGVAVAVARRFTHELPPLSIVGTFAGSPRPADEKAILARLKKARPTILIVAYGAPAQERWLARNLPKLRSVKLAIGVGGAFDFHAGLIRRAPRVFRAFGLEWVWRLLRQPARLPRIWTATYRFLRLVWMTRNSKFKIQNSK